MSIHFVSIHYSAAENRKNSLKAPYFGAEGHSRSLMSIALKARYHNAVIISTLRLSASVFTLDKRVAQNHHFLRGYSYLATACAGLVKRKRLGSRQLKSTFNAKNFICRLSWSISRHFGAIHS